MRPPSRRPQQPAGASATSAEAPVTALRPAGQAPVRPPAASPAADLVRTRALWLNLRTQSPDITPEQWLATLVRLNAEADAEIAALMATLRRLERGEPSS